MLTLRDLSLQRGGKPLFEAVALSIYAGQKVGVIGVNGTGKSSLFALLRGEIHQDAGDLNLPASLVIAHVAQETPAVRTQAIAYVMDGDGELRRIEADMGEAEANHDGVRLAELHGRYDAIDGYTARARAGQLMAGLGFPADQLERPVAEFSGGWRVRLNLARALMCRSDMLLLDEPTNHLDLDAVLWLEQWLRGYTGTLLLISHDRDFLDNVVDHIAHLEQHRINLYNGDYSAFERQRAERLAQQQATYEKQQRERAHLRAFIDRFRAKATKARQAQSRIKALNRMEQVSAAHVDSPFHFEFAIPEKLPNPLLTLDSVAVGYGDSTILSQVSLVITPGTRLGLLGPNGAGKSTLVKLLAGVLDPLKGRLEFGQGLSVGYFAQHQLEQLRPEWGALQHLRKLTPDANEQALRDFLGGFGFAGDRALAPVAPFSGGEKARLALAILVWQRPNLLLLDEPTNHLDLDMRHALNRALQAYEGGLIVVSHDRHLLRTSTDAFALVADGGFVPFDGDLEDYASWLNGRRGAAVSPGAKKPGGGAIERRDRKRVAADKRAQLGLKRRPLNQRARALEEMMDRLNTEKARIELALTAPDIYDDAHKSRLRELLRRQGEVSRELEQHESEWLDLQEALEALDV